MGVDRGSASSCFIAGDVTWSVLQDVLHNDAYPNVGDVFYVSGYVLIAIGLSMLWRFQRAIANIGALVDGLIVGVAAAVLLWVFFIGPAVLDGSRRSRRTVVQHRLSGGRPAADRDGRAAGDAARPLGAVVDAAARAW